MHVHRRWVAYAVILTAFFEQLVWLPVFTAVSVTAWAIALGQTAYSLANLGGNVLAGALADRLGRRTVAGVSLLAAGATALGHLAAAAGGEPRWWLAARFAHGFAIAGVVPAAFALISDIAPRGERGGVMARSGVAIAVASILANAVGGVMVRRLGVAPTVAALAVLLAAVGAFALVALPGGRRRVFAGPGPEPAAGPGAGPGAPPAGAAPGALALGLAAAGALMFGQNVLTFAVPLQVREMGLGAQVTGALFATFGVTALLVFLFLGRAADRWGRRSALGTGFALVALAQGALASAPALPAMLTAMAAYGLGFGLAFPALSALVGDGAPPGRRGLAMGLLGATFSLGAAAGPVVSRALTDWVSPFAVSAAVILTALALTTFWGAFFPVRRDTPPTGRIY